MIRTTCNKTAFERFQLSDKMHNTCLHRWVHDTSKPPTDYRAFYHVDSSTKQTSGFVLLRRCDEDGLGIHLLNPWLIEFIYVQPARRRQGIALELLEMVKTIGFIELTAFITNDTTETLFRRASFTKFNLMNEERKNRGFTKRLGSTANMVLS